MTTHDTRAARIAAMTDAELDAYIAANQRPVSLVMVDIFVAKPAELDLAAAIRERRRRRAGRR
jgi:PleD family two-component response regulator